MATWSIVAGVSFVEGNDGDDRAGSEQIVVVSQVADEERDVKRPLEPRIVASLDMPVKSDHRTVLAATLRIAEETERNGEIRSVEEFISAFSSP